MTRGGSRSRRRHGERPAPRNPRWVTPQRRKWVTNWAPPKGQLAERPADFGAAWASVASCEDYEPGRSPAAFLAGAILGTPCTPDEAWAEVAAHPGGALLVDTIDLVLDDVNAATWAATLRAFGAAGLGVVVSCRAWEWQNVLRPRLSDAAAIVLPPFSPTQALGAARGYCAREGVPPEPFVARLSELMTEDRRLDAIVRNPLLLSLVCQIFGPTGGVPADLTVLKLYDELVDRRIRRTRRGGGPDDALSRAKERLCHRFAREVVRRTDRHVQEVLSREALGEEGDAFAALRSDGILEEVAGLRVRFFHQTFLEYIVGAWLTTEPAVAREFLGRLAREESVPYSAAALVRMYLAQIPGDEERLDVALSLPLGKLPLFNAAALAWAAHGAPAALMSELMARAEATPRGFEQGLVDAVAALSGAWTPEVAALALRMAGRFEAPAVQSLIPLIVQNSAELSEEQRLALTTALAERSVPDAHFLSMLAGELGRQDTPACARWLVELGARFHEIGPRGQRAVVGAIARLDDPARRSAFFERAKAHPADNEWLEEATELVAAVLRDRAASSGTIELGGAAELLRDPLPPDWDTRGYRALGRLLAGAEKADRDTAVQSFVTAVASGPKDMIPRILTVLSEALDKGLPAAALQDALSRLGPPSPDRSKPLARLERLANGERRSAGEAAGEPRRVADSAAPDADLSHLQALSEAAMGPKRTLALKAAQSLAEAAEAGRFDASNLARLFSSQFPGVRAAAYGIAGSVLQKRAVDGTARQALRNAAVRAMTGETTASPFTAALELLHQSVLVDGVPGDAPRLLASLLSLLSRKWIDGGCVLRILRVAEDFATRSPEASRAACWSALAPHFLSFNLGKYKGAEKHLVPTLRYLVPMVHDEMAEALRDAQTPIPYENLRALYLALQSARPDSSLLPFLIEKAPLLATVSPVRA